MRADGQAAPVRETMRGGVEGVMGWSFMLRVPFGQRVLSLNRD